MPTIIIPARLESTRLPRKMLLNDTGYPLLWHTAQCALQSRLINDIIIATENIEIMDVVEKFGHPRIYPILTPQCNSGTERVAWIVDNIRGFDFSFVVNFQGDEPELPGKNIDDLINALMVGSADIATLATSASKSDYFSSSVTKVVLDHTDNAIYFSRSPIPYGLCYAAGQSALAHIGIYAYRLDVLLVIPTLFDGTLKTEKLEQLQWLQSGFKIRVLKKSLNVAGIDTLEEYAKFVQRWKTKEL